MCTRPAHLLVPLALLVALPAAAGEEGWKEISKEDGITCWQRPVPGTSLVEFRGQTVIEAPMRMVLAVLHDNKRKKEWMENTIENRLLRYSAPGKTTIYNRLGSPFPLISDRDMVVKTDLEIRAKEKRVLIEGKAVEDAVQPPVPGVVRMPRLEVHWDIQAIDANRTNVIYQVQADPGGSIPQWLVNLASKKLPHNTLAKMRKQMSKDYTEALAVIDTAFDWSSVSFSSPEKTAAAP